MLFILAYWLYLLPLAVFLFFGIIILVASRFETIPVHELVALPASEMRELSAYHAEMNRQAEQCGFLNCGLFQHSKGGTYQVLVSLWLSPDFLTLASVASGRLLRLQVRRTRMTSRLADATYLETVDEHDLANHSAISSIETLYKADFHELSRRHQERLHAASGVVQVNSADGALQVYRDRETALLENLVARGLAYYADPARTTWRQTVKAGLLTAMRQPILYRGAERKALVQRSSLKRPGEKGYIDSISRNTGAAVPVAQLVHAGFGIVSLILVPATAGLVVVAMWRMLTAAEDRELSAKLMSYGLFSGVFGVFAGVKGLLQKQRIKTCAILGLVLNTVMLIAPLLIIVLGILFSAHS